MYNKIVKMSTCGGLRRISELAAVACVLSSLYRPRSPLRA